MEMEKAVKYQDEEKRFPWIDEYKVNGQVRLWINYNDFSNSLPVRVVQQQNMFATESTAMQ